MKKRLVLVIPLTIIICITISLVIYFNSNQYKLKKMNETMKNLGSSYYEEYYYPTLGIEKIKESKSIVITLDTIENTKIYENNEDLKKLDKCDKDNTYVKVTPKSPYKSTDYNFDINLDCEVET